MESAKQKFARVHNRSKLRRHKRHKKKEERGRARDRTGIARIRIWSDDHYTTQPMLLIGEKLLHL